MTSILYIVFFYFIIVNVKVNFQILVGYKNILNNIERAKASIEDIKNRNDNIDPINYFLNEYEKEKDIIVDDDRYNELLLFFINSINRIENTEKIKPSKAEIGYLLTKLGFQQEITFMNQINNLIKICDVKIDKDLQLVINISKFIENCKKLNNDDDKEGIKIIYNDYNKQLSLVKKLDCKVQEKNEACKFMSQLQKDDDTLQYVFQLQRIKEANNKNFGYKDELAKELANYIISFYLINKIEHTITNKKFNNIKILIIDSLKDFSLETDQTQHSGGGAKYIPLSVLQSFLILFAITAVICPAAIIATNGLALPICIPAIATCGIIVLYILINTALYTLYSALNVPDRGGKIKTTKEKIKVKTLQDLKDAANKKGVKIPPNLKKKRDIQVYLDAFDGHTVKQLKQKAAKINLTIPSEVKRKSDLLYFVFSKISIKDH